MSGWMARLEAALLVGGCTTLAEWVAKYPGTHCWFTFDVDRPTPIVSCACCGTIRRSDDKNKPCKGVVKIALRGAA